MQTHLPLRIAVACCVSLLMLFNSGCRASRRPADVKFAGVDIPGRSIVEVAQMTVTVFEEHGYELASKPSTDLVFEKEGSRGDVFQYGSWLDKNVWVRVRVSVEPSPSDSAMTRLQAGAWVVRDRGDARFEEEQKMPALRRRAYQDILEEIAGRL